MNVLIYDSKKSNVHYLSEYIQKKYYWSVTGYSTLFGLATAVYDEYKGDVELIMIHIADNGESIESAKDIQEFFPHIRLIFYSEKMELIERIFSAYPLFFLKLPFEKEWLDKAFERVNNSLSEDIGRTFNIQSRGRKIRIKFIEIKYLESVKRKLILYTDAGTFETYMTMDEALGQLPDNFIQCHRSYIANIERMTSFDNNEITFSHHEHIPVSRTYLKTIKAISTRRTECL